MAPPSTTSPVLRKPAAQFNIHEEPNLGDDVTQPQVICGASGAIKRASSAVQQEATIPLTTSKLANKQSTNLDQLGSSFKKTLNISEQIRDGNSPIDRLLKELSRTQQKAPNAEKASISPSTTLDIKQPSVLTEQVHRSEDMKPDGMDASEMLKLKKELEEAKDKIAQMDQQLSKSRTAENIASHSAGSPVASEHQLKFSPEEFIRKFQASSNLQRQSLTEDTKSERSGSYSPRPFEQSSIPWGHEARPDLEGTFQGSNSRWSQPIPGAWGRPDATSISQAPTRQFANRPAPLRLVDNFDSSMQGFPTSGYAALDQGIRRANFHNGRPGSAMGPYCNAWGSYPNSIASSPGFSPPMTPMPFPSAGYGPSLQPYQPRPIGTPLSPTAIEFSAAAMSSTGSYQGNAWNAQAASENHTSSSSYMPHVEPMNYRRLLDKNMSCNWKHIVDKIVCNNDQQASIFLQQKLKVATPEQKFELIEAIIAQAYPLMINRFGNFLVQRCFEHGTPEQVIAIANAIRGNTLNLSMDAFGCHVVQKAFDVVPEDYKAIMVHELLRRIPETVIHRYACHVWQKLFELRWSDSPPQIMKYVNEALRGMWHEVALGETGSLVVQNIFENCLEEDKRPCINEVLASIDIVSHGQFGNWCIQHICEHGAPADKSRAVEHVIRFATEYSTDQFASKVVEKCLKVGGPEFLERYLERVCEGRPDRPRMPLIDIAGDQYGNYLVQYILINADPQHREAVAQHVRKHMVSLRGSKFGSRVAMLCCNPALATRPGPPVGMPMNNRFFPSSNMSTNMPNGSGGPMAGSRQCMPGPYR